MMKRLAVAVTLAASCHDEGPLSKPNATELSEPQTLLQVGADDADILVLVDNSISSAGMGGLLSDWFELYLAHAHGIRDDRVVHVAFATTESSHPACSARTNRSDGELELSSCRDRAESFIAAADGDTIDQYEQLCERSCREGLDWPELVLEAHSSTDGVPVVRPWLAVRREHAGVASEHTFSQAVSCLLPQGIDGCAFVSPLEAMYETLTAARDPSSASFGFLRPHADLVVLVLTHGFDCSANVDQAAAFAPGSVYWRDPAITEPEPGICWRAGVACIGEGPEYDTCYVADRDVNGASVTGDQALAQAALHPISRYRQLLEALDREKREAGFETTTEFHVIGGVPHELGASIGETWPTISYRQPTADGEHVSMAIEPSCANPNGHRAYPPVRLLEFVRQAELPVRTHWSSICGSEWGERPFRRIGWLSQPQSMCFEGCVSDTDDELAGVQSACKVELVTPDGATTVEVPECVRTTAGRYARANDSFVVPETAKACFVARTDPGGVTPDPNDDTGATDCPDWPHQVEFELVATGASSLAPGMQARAQCRIPVSPEPGCEAQ